MGESCKIDRRKRRGEAGRGICLTLQNSVITMLTISCRSSVRLGIKMWSCLKPETPLFCFLQIPLISNIKLIYKLLNINPQVSVRREHNGFNPGLCRSSIERERLVDGVGGTLADSCLLYGDSQRGEVAES